MKVATWKQLLAQSSFDHRFDNNMPSVLSGFDIVNATTVNKADMVYRPLYYLPGAYQSTARRWRDEYRAKRLTPSERLVSFQDLKSKTWAQLGITGTVEDEASASDDAQFKDLQVTLKYTGLGAFDVKRGLW